MMMDWYSNLDQEGMEVDDMVTNQDINTLCDLMKPEPEPVSRVRSICQLFEGNRKFYLDGTASAGMKAVGNLKNISARTLKKGGRRLKKNKPDDLIQTKMDSFLSNLPNLQKIPPRIVFDLFDGGGKDHPKPIEGDEIVVRRKRKLSGGQYADTVPQKNSKLDKHVSPPRW